jgi:hypothetical protein
MMSNKADATHQAMNRHDLMAHAVKSRCYASGWTQGKGGRHVQSALIYIKKQTFFVPNALSWSNSVTPDL